MVHASQQLSAGNTMVENPNIDQILFKMNAVQNNRQDSKHRK